MPRQVIYQEGLKSIIVSLTDLGISAIHVSLSKASGAFQANNDKFVLGTRKLIFQRPDEKKLKKTIATSIQHNTLPSGINKTTELLAKLAGADPRQIMLLPYFKNQNRGEEVFYPITIDAEKSRGVYAYPWLSSESSKQLGQKATFKRFVTAGCLFGSSLLGYDQEGGSYPLIKHDLTLHEGQIIEDIAVAGKSFYEELQFSQLKSMASLIHNTTHPEESKRLDYHLPCFDYALYVIKLFLNKKITAPALEVSFTLIAERRNKHVKEIRKICGEFGIEVNISSPFDGIFTLKDDTESAFISSLYQMFPFLRGGAGEVPSEQEFVDLILEKLKEHNSSPVLANLWKINSGERLKEIEDLFNIANPIMVAATANGTEDAEVCSILPVSEKQIQVGYKRMSKTANDPQMFPVVFNLTLLDMSPVYTASNKKNGLSFYASDPDLNNCLSQVHEWLTKAQERVAELGALTPMTKFTAGASRSTGNPLLQLRKSLEEKEHRGSISSSSGTANTYTSDDTGCGSERSSPTPS